MVVRDCASVLNFCIPKKGKYKCTNMLVHAGADVNARDNKGLSVLAYAVVNGHYKCVHALKKSGALTIEDDIWSHAKDSPFALKIERKLVRHCELCGLLLPHMFKCPVCKQSYFCSKECFRNSWPTHRQQCHSSGKAVARSL